MNGQAVLVDTDVVSFLLKQDRRVEPYQRYLSGRLLVLSFMSLAELYRWAEVRGWGERRKREMEMHLRGFIIPEHSHELCRTWARVMAQAQRHGRALSCADGWIAATAVLHDIPLVTHNRKHFEGVQGLEVISESEAQADEG